MGAADMDMDVVLAVRKLGGQARWGELLDHVPRRRIEAALAAGQLVKLARGRYALPELPRAAAVASQVAGVVSHLSAAEHHRLTLLLPPVECHVTVRCNSHPTAPERTRVHWRNLAAHDVHDGVTTPLRTVLDCAADLPFAEALAVADQALSFGLVRSRELRDAAAAWTGRRLGAVQRVARQADGRAAGPFESALRATALEGGCTEFEPQVSIPTSGHGAARVDLGDRRRRVVLEADSFEWHGDRKALRRDCRRYDELVRAGWSVLRFSWEDVMFDAAWVKSVIRDVVRSARLHGEECPRSCRCGGAS